MESMREEFGWRVAATLSWLLFAFFTNGPAWSADLTPDQPLDDGKRTAPIDNPSPAAPPPCPAARERATRLLADLGASLPAQTKSAAQQYVAKPGPGVSPAKAWHDFAAGAALLGDFSLAAWASLTAAELEWSGETVSGAAVYLLQLDKTQDSLHLLTCAYAMGYRSPYLFEALATAHHKLSHRSEARQAIAMAYQLAPDDRLIETAASLLTTGQPPPAPPPPQRDDLNDAIRELEERAAQLLSKIQVQADTLDASLPDAHARERYAIAQTYLQNLLQVIRDQARAVRAADPRARQFMTNSVLALSISSYANMTDTFLSFSHSTSNSTSLLFWATVLGLDAPILGRESRRDAASWDMHGGPALAQGARDAYDRDKTAAYSAHNKRFYACRDNECKVRETARWCGEWKPLYERWANDSRQRHDKAARSFDRIATQTVIRAENELLQTRDYAVRQLKKMKFSDAPGMEQTTLQGINQAVGYVFDRHLNPSAKKNGTTTYIQERARWFEVERTSMEEQLAREAEEIKRECVPAMQALLELLIQEEWQAYLGHLRDRIAWDIQGQAETSEFPCEGTIGPLTIGTDLNRPGEGKLDIKWSRKNVPVSISGSVTLRQDQTFGVGVGVSYKGESSSGMSGSGSGTVRDDLGKSGIGGGAGVGPYAAKANVTYTSKVSPWNSREYLGIKLKGSAGLGLKRKIKNIDVGVACYPSNGSVTFYPRALFEDAVRYLSTPAAPPR
jgi:hypothetical protein